MAKKGGNAWDDSALIDAFDRAISKYKVMHGINKPSDTSETGGLTDAEGIASSSTEAIEPTESSEGKPNHIHYTAVKNGISQNNGSTHEEYLHIQENQPGQESHNSCQIPGATIHANSEGYDSNGYWQLLQQYYELEEQRMKILHQLYQANYWNYQFSLPSLSYPACQVSHSNGSVGGTTLPSAPYSHQYVCHPELCTMCNYHSGYQGSYAPWSSAWSTSPQVPTGGQQVSGDSHRPGPTSNDAKEAVAQAERAISSLDLESSPGSVQHKDGKRIKETQDATARSDSHNVNSEVDLCCVLGAWYTAGFYTGRYLLGQSSKRGT